jgi:lysozyme
MRPNNYLISLVAGGILLAGAFMSEAYAAVSKKGVEFTKGFEGYRSTKYWDVDGYSIGYGHKILPGENYKSLSEEEARKILMSDLNKSERSLDSYVKVNLNQDQRDALCNFIFNLGERNFKRSTLLKKLNKSDYAGAAGEIKKWNKAGRKVLEGLKKRRQAEYDMFMSK